MSSVGEVVDGELNKIVIALHNPKVRPNVEQPRLGDFVSIKTRGLELIGVVSHIAFKSREHPQPLGLTPEQVKAVMPDIEDVVYANVLKLAYIPIVGYVEKGKAYQTTPPLLPDIHDEAFMIDDDGVKAFHQSQNKIAIEYFPRLLREDVEYQAEALGAVYKRLHKVLNLDTAEFLRRVNSAFEETRGEQIPTSFASTLNRLIR